MKCSSNSIDWKDYVAVICNSWHLEAIYSLNPLTMPGNKLMMILVSQVTLSRKKVHRPRTGRCHDWIRGEFKFKRGQVLDPPIMNLNTSTNLYFPTNAVKRVGALIWVLWKPKSSLFLCESLCPYWTLQCIEMQEKLVNKVKQICRYNLWIPVMIGEICWKDFRCDSTSQCNPNTIGTKVYP